MNRRATWLGLAVCAACLTGCVERRFVITTSPPGTIVYDESRRPMGAAPADHQFTYYGKYRFTLVHDGFETMTVEEKVKAPWYEFIFLDFISENVIPWTIKDVRRFHYDLKSVQIIPEEEILQKGGLLRQKGKEIGEPLPARFPEPAPAPRPVPFPQPQPAPNPQPKGP